MSAKQSPMSQTESEAKAKALAVFEATEPALAPSDYEVRNLPASYAQGKELGVKADVYADESAIAILAKAAGIKVADIVAQQGRDLLDESGAVIPANSKIGHANRVRLATLRLAKEKPGKVALVLGLWDSTRKPEGGSTGHFRPWNFIVRK